MKKQELIATYERISNFAETVEIKSVIEKLKQLEEPETQVPQFVADWIETCKENNIISLSGAFEYAKEEVDIWLSDWTNQETFARAWLYGYTVEEGKRYIVASIKTGQCLYRRDNDYVFMVSIMPNGNPRFQHTRKELEVADFGWVFDCPGIEIEEVE